MRPENAAGIATLLLVGLWWGTPMRVTPLGVEVWFRLDPLTVDPAWAYWCAKVEVSMTVPAV